MYTTMIDVCCRLDVCVCTRMSTYLSTCNTRPCVCMCLSAPQIISLSLYIHIYIYIYIYVCT